MTGFALHWGRETLADPDGMAYIVLVVYVLKWFDYHFIFFFSCFLLNDCKPDIKQLFVGLDFP